MTIALSPIRISLNQQADTAWGAGSSTRTFMPNARAHGAFRYIDRLALKPTLKASLKTSLVPLLSSPIRPNEPAWPNMPARLDDSPKLPAQSV